MTHLISSKRAYKDNHELVQQAKKRRGKVKIVSLEWSMDSLMGKDKKPLDTEKYEFGQRKLKKIEVRKENANDKANAPESKAGKDAKENSGTLVTTSKSPSLKTTSSEKSKKVEAKPVQPETNDPKMLLDEASNSYIAEMAASKHKSKRHHIITLTAK